MSHATVPVEREVSALQARSLSLLLHDANVRRVLFRAASTLAVTSGPQTNWGPGGAAGRLSMTTLRRSGRSPPVAPCLKSVVVMPGGDAPSTTDKDFSARAQERFSLNAA